MALLGSYLQAEWSVDFCSGEGARRSASQPKTRFEITDQTTPMIMASAPAIVVHCSDVR
jgi:hypothetical protein